MSHDAERGDPDTPHIHADLRARSRSLADAIQAQRDADALDKAARRDKRARTAQAGSAYNLGMRMLAELVAGILVGLALGYGLDHWLGTGPILMIVFLLLGTAAAILNVMRAASAPPR